MAGHHDLMEPIKASVNVIDVIDLIANSPEDVKVPGSSADEIETSEYPGKVMEGSDKEVKAATPKKGERLADSARSRSDRRESPGEEPEEKIRGKYRS